MNAPAEPDPEFDTLRAAVLALEAMQRSPPEPIVLVLAEFAATLDCSPSSLERILQRLSDLRLIEGPGTYNGAWLFRRLTKRGRAFVDEVRSEMRWEEIKRAYFPSAW